ncbi:MAG: DUF4831 family protein [Bacteroidales bacterium]|nr:DUF4831 family protein [Bacteroidales bacterium]
MRRILAAAIVLAASFQAMAQDATYALPFTSFTVEVDLVHQNHFAGPYSAFAKDMLNMDVPASDVKKTYIKEIRIVPHLEADPWAARYTAPVNSSLLRLSAQGLIAFGEMPETGLDWRFQPAVTSSFGANGITGATRQQKNIVYKTMETEEGEVKVPVEHAITVAKTLEDKAAEAAELILNVRQDRHNIAVGNTDANYSGESMAAALAELTKLEQEYILLFTGYDTVSESHASFEVLPSSTARTNRYTAFYMTEDGKLVKENKTRAKPYELEFTPVALPDVKSEPVQDVNKAKKQEKVATIHYRIPAICRVRLLEDGLPLVESRIPVYQLGREAEMPINQ